MVEIKLEIMGHKQEMALKSRFRVSQDEVLCYSQILTNLIVLRNSFLQRFTRLT